MYNAILIWQGIKLVFKRKGKVKFQFALPK